MLEALAAVAVFLVILSALVLVHELGHFAVARFFGVHVEEFGIGFPPRALSAIRGKTRYSLNWLPLGGFVKLKGEQGEGARDPDSFASKPVWQRVCILAAGVAMNLLLTILIFTYSFASGTPQALHDAEVALARDVQIAVTTVLASSPAESAGVKPGDIIVRLDDASFSDIPNLQAYVRDRVGVPVTLELKRGKETVRTSATPIILKENGRPGFGVGLARVGSIAYPIHVAFWKSLQATAAMAGFILTTLGNAVRNLAFDGFVGPVGIAATTATVTKLGASYLLNLIAQLSLSLAIFNFLPIPALDGGRVLFAVLEKFRRKSLEPAIENAVHVIGFLILIGLLILVTVRDIARLISG